MSTLVTHGQGVVATWLGVTTAAVSNWIVRHWDDIPKPAAVVITPAGDEVLGWTEDQRQDWADWFAANHAQPATRSNRPRHFS